MKKIFINFVLFTLVILFLTKCESMFEGFPKIEVSPNDTVKVGTMTFVKVTGKLDSLTFEDKRIIPDGNIYNIIFIPDTVKNYKVNCWKSFSSPKFFPLEFKITVQ